MLALARPTQIARGQDATARHSMMHHRDVVWLIPLVGWMGAVLSLLMIDRSMTELSRGFCRTSLAVGIARRRLAHR
jgi:hypothetical protein